MASYVIRCIDDALLKVELLVERADYTHEQKMFKVLRFRLRNLGTFVLSARNLGDDDSFGPFLERVKDMVGRNAAEIQHHIDLSDIRLDMRVAFKFRRDIQSLGKDMDVWYTAMMDCKQSRALVIDQVLEILSSVLLNLEDFQSFRSTILHAEILGEAMENLGEYVKFLESLICFATLISDELQQNLLARAEAVAIKFAHLLFTCRVDKFDEESGKRMHDSITIVQQMIKPADPQVYDAYTQALINFKLSRGIMHPNTRMDDDAFIAMKNFLDALISVLWEILRVGSSAVDQLQELYEGLRSLRTILKQQPSRFSMNLNEDIEVVVCDAGVLICSLDQIDLEVDLRVSNVLNTITSILGQVGGKNASETPMFNTPRTNELGYVDFVLDKLAQLESGKAEQLQVELRFLRSYMGGIVELRCEQVELQTLWDRVLEMAYRIEHLIDRLLVGNMLDSRLIDTVLEDIRAMKADVLRTSEGMQGEIEVQEGKEIYRHELSPKVPSISDDEFVGFEDDVNLILDRLNRGSKHLQIVTIVGMAGLGKTTLAAKIYNSEKYRFHHRAWCHISQVMNKKKVLLDLLNQVDRGISSNDLGRSLRGYAASDIDDLIYMVRQRLKGRRYLIVLDDIWDAISWDDLCLVFPDDYIGSRILMTSRIPVTSIIPHVHSRTEPHFVRRLDTNESLKLLQLKLLPQTKWLVAPLDLQMQIVEKCKGLPLTIIIVAGLLANIEPMGLEGVVKDVLQCTDVFELSYKYLPDYLKPCLLYFGAFPCGEEVSVRRLVRIWMAEGFVQKHDRESLENVAERYLNDLVSRSLIVVSKKRSIRGVKACRIHDLLHDFCLKKAKEEHPFNFLKGIDKFRAMKDELRTFEGMLGEIKVQERNEIQELSPKVPSISDDEFVGFENDVNSIWDRLIHGSKRLQIVTIAGMAGSGKTTLAAKIYNQASVKFHFHRCAWCYISHVMDKEKVLLDLLNQVDSGISSNDIEDMLRRGLRGYAASDTTLGDLENMLRHRLSGMKYLIVLDDVWDARSWDDLCSLFPDDNNGSRILMTSRNCDVVHFRTDPEPHFVRQLNINESLKLLRLKLLPHTWLGAPLELQMQVVEKCQGLPLTIISLAGLLANIEPMGWEGVLENFNSNVTECIKVFELSYKYLPDYLKPCLLYFGALPYGEEVSVRRLVRLWMAEGFVQKHDQESQENAAERYLNNLISRSMIMVSKKRSIGGVKACHIHDLIYAFCLQKAKDEHFFHFLEGRDELLAFNEPQNLRRLCIHSEPKHFKQSKLFCPRARSLLFNMSQRVHRAEVQLDVSFIVHIFKLLRVLDLQQISLDSELPSEIELLVQLAFLAIRGKMRLIPSSIAKLSNLETLIVDAGRHVLSLPDGLWSLQKLKYVYIKSFENFGGGHMSIQNVHSSVFSELDRFSGAVFPSWSSMKEILTKFPNIRKLKCMLNFELGDDEKNHDYKNIDLDFLRQLESLHILSYGGLPFDGMFEFSLPLNLKKLTLSHFYLTWSNISTIGKLPHLEVFKLLHIILEGETWDMVEGTFLELRILTLSSISGLIAWRSGDDEMHCLKKLVLNECESLEELPDCLHYAPMLEMIEISNCPERLADLVRRIEEEHHDLGNSDFKIIIPSSKEFSATP